MVRIVAHRGARSLAPENTLAAFSRALSLPVCMVEGDVALTKDGIPVMIHQETLEPDDATGRLKLARRNEGRAWISARNYSEIKDLDAGSWFSKEFSSQRIPKLSDVLNLCWHGKTLLLDLIDPVYWSNPDDASVVQQFKTCVVPVLKQAACSGVALSVLAFNPAMLEMFKQELPQIPRTLAIWTNQRGKEAWISEIIVKFGITTLTIADFMLHDEPLWLTTARACNVNLGVYELTPDSHEEFRAWTPAHRRPVWDLVIENRVDWFTSDFPAEFAAYRDSKP